MTMRHSSYAELEAALLEIERSPRERGTLSLIVRRPRKARYMSSGPANMPSVPYASLRRGQVSALQVMVTIIASECPTIYLVAACTETSQPCAKALK